MVTPIKCNLLFRRLETPLRYRIFLGAVQLQFLFSVTEPQIPTWQCAVQLRYYVKKTRPNRAR